MSNRRQFLWQSAAAAISTNLLVTRSDARAREATGTQGDMPRHRIPHSDLTVSRLAYGCSELGGWSHSPLAAEDLARAEPLIRTVIDQGINLFDHADLYGFGRSESLFGEILKKSPGLRANIVLQSKCGQMFRSGGPRGIDVDLSRGHILSSAEGSLRRLATDYLDILLLHAPSTLVRPEEVAAAFDELHQSGKVRYFGVSNHNAAQIQLLKKAVRQPLIINQIHLGLASPDALADGMEFTLGLYEANRSNPRYLANSGSGTFDYCRLENIQVQAYSPLRGDLLKPMPDSSAAIKATSRRLGQIAADRHSTSDAVALAWLLHHPASIIPIIGATKPEHIAANCGADRLTLSDQEWYGLLLDAAGLSERQTHSA